ncbi:MAG: histidine--tRNA ligase [Deltaproteobacteria bacterium]|nr:histidine--tRNA ligase [Deltaproteobacteria bacterium]
MKDDSERLQSVKGMYDLLPPDSLRLREVERIGHEVLRRYGYVEVRTPVVEYTTLFSRSIGDATDIVEKEMYTFTDRDERSITMRPEGTAGAVRAYVEHAIHKADPVSRWYYLGPMFRHERWQRGRYRQFHQLGVEVFGVADPGADAEVMALVVDLARAFGLEELELKVNTLGCAECRPAYRAGLVAFLEPRRELLCEDCQRRFGHNPLRVLDCKQERCRALSLEAPSPVEHACEGCAAHWQGVLADLRALEVACEVDARLVRGLDYYSRTTFELVSHGGQLGSQNTLAGGGRYDGLVGQLGGPPTPAVGFAMGLERLLLALPEDRPALASLAQVVFVTRGEPARRAALPMVQALRSRGIAVELDHRGMSVKSQMKRADRVGCSVVVLVGEDELQREVVTVRRMATSTQEEVPVVELAARIDGLLRTS